MDIEPVPPGTRFKYEVYGSKNTGTVIHCRTRLTKSDLYECQVAMDGWDAYSYAYVDVHPDGDDVVTWL